MSVFSTRPATRWLAPGAAVVLVGGVALVANHSASADPSLPPRSAAQLLVDVQQARLAGLSGTVVQTSNLGLPSIAGLGGGGGAEGGSGGSSALSSTIAGTHTWRVWLAGQDRQRLALVGSLGESDLIRDGRNVWMWSSKDKTATHTVLPAESATGDHSGAAGGAPGAGATPGATPSPTDLPKTPQEAAQRALAALDPTTSVTTSGTSSVAGRSAYDLVLKPRDAQSLVAQVRISIDATKHVPLRVQVYSTRTANPAFEVGFTSVDFATPAASQFAFNPPPGTKVTEHTFPAKADLQKGSAAARAQADASRPTVVGKGWTTVLVGKLPTSTGSTSPGTGASGDRAGVNGATGAKGAASLQGMLALLPKVSGTWGSGHLLSGTLFSAVVTTDGRYAVGAVAPDRLYAALAAQK
ncbi:outer membrane lipoprotein carrier protein LolA [Pedococcus sp. NPDC057267]|uniref:LolA family protein n=1 Tax=Pedococcus sp. NPDC057267 TaxID=3346077 RepID=UPI0036316F5D